MGKVILILLAALAVGLYVPQSRKRIWQTVRPVTFPFYGWMSRGEMKRIAKDLNQYEQDYRQFPGPRGFGDWMDKRYKDENLTRDSWGTRYELKRGPRHTFLIVSAGPDRTFDTGDDLTTEGVRPDLR